MMMINCYYYYLLLLLFIIIMSFAVMRDHHKLVEQAELAFKIRLAASR